MRKAPIPSCLFYVIFLYITILVFPTCSNVKTHNEKEVGAKKKPIIFLLKGDGVEVSLIFNEVASTIYLLDVLSGFSGGNRSSIEMTRKELEKIYSNPGEVGILLKKYADIRKKYDYLMDRKRSGDYYDISLLDAPVPVSPSWVEYNPASNINTLASRVESWKEFWNYANLLMNQGDKEVLHDIVEKLLPSVRSLFKECSGIYGIPGEAGSKIEKSPMLFLLGRIMKFYGLDSGKNSLLKIGVNFVPVFGNGETTYAVNKNGTIYIESQVCMEMGNESVRLPLDVVFHEAVHTVERSISKEKWEKIARRYFISGLRSLSAGWWIYNEALATAFGQGIFLKRYEKRKFEEKMRIVLGLYRDKEIDNYARLLIPQLEEKLEKGGSLDEFSAEGGRVFTLLTSPDISASYYLKKGVLFSGCEYLDKVKEVFHFHGSDLFWAYKFEDSDEGLKFFEKYAGISGVIFSQGKDMEKAEAIFSRMGCDSVETLISENEMDKFRIIIKRGKRLLSGYVYFVYVSDDSLIEKSANLLFSN